MYANFFSKLGLPVCDRRGRWSDSRTMEERAFPRRHSGVNSLESYHEVESKVHSVEMSTVTISEQESKHFIKLIDKDQNFNVLDISNLVSRANQVVRLPDKVIRLPGDLNESNVNNDESNECPELLDLLKHLNEFQVQNNMIRSLKVADLKNLVSLNLSNNKLTELPDNLSALKNLEMLDLSRNELVTLPVSYGTLRKLKGLDISDNQFKAIPKCIRDGMVTLKILDISRNVNMKMNIIPSTKSLEKFYAKENGNCGKFPDWIVTPKFFNLREVNLSQTKFDFYSFTGKEGDLNLRSLTMECSNLSNTVVEMMIENMVCLEQMNLGNEEVPYNNSENIFNDIPVEALRNPLTITEINFRATSLPSITSQINKCVNLKKLDVGLNCIMWLPQELCTLEKLEYLIIDGNSLFMLPENFGNLKSLKVLKMNANALVKLPKSFENLSNLRLADFYDNKFEEIPNVLLQLTNLQGLDIEQNYFSTSNVKIGEKSYSELYDTYAAYYNKHPKSMYDTRSKGAKKCETIKSDGSLDFYSGFNRYGSSDEECSVESNKSVHNHSDDNWDENKDTDDEYDPEDPKFKFDKGKFKNYMYQKPQGFCPEDLHLKRIKAEVASMKAYGSLPTYQIEPGQFDDAE